MVLEKLINVSKIFDTIIGGTISEYDIKNAGATAILELKGKEIYDSLMVLDKKERNIKIGLMMKNEPGLAKKVNELMLKWLNLFIKENRIKPKNLIYTTRDSIVVYNKLPLKIKFGDVEFVNKDGIFSSMYKIKNIFIFFDSMGGKILVKGLDDKIVQESDFFQKYLIKFLYMIESCQKNSDSKIFNILRLMREGYIKSNSVSIYRDLTTENKLPVRYNGDIMYVENEIELENEKEFFIAKDINYINFVMPIMRSVLLNG